MDHEKKNVLKVDGMMKSPGALDCDEVRVNGMFKVNGNLKTDLLDGDGMITIKGNAIVNTIDIDGMLKVSGDIEAKKVDIDGMIKAKSINGDDVKIDGKFSISNNINCDNLHLSLNGNSTVDNIEGSDIRVLRSRSRKHQLKVSTITADVIDIECVTCDTISGDKVKIGKGCIINNVTYLTSLEIDPQATVKNQNQEK